MSRTSDQRFHGPYQGGAPVTVEERIGAQLQGRQALFRGESPAGCPYKADRSERGRYLAVMWFRGWRAAQDELRGA